MAGYFLLQPLWLLMDQSADVGYLKLPMELHAKVISLLEIGHILSKPMVLESVLFLGYMFLYLLHIKALIDIAHESVICEKKP